MPPQGGTDEVKRVQTMGAQIERGASVGVHVKLDKAEKRASDNVKEANVRHMSSYGEIGLILNDGK